MVEMVSLVDYTDYDPSIDHKLFPDTHTDLYYWTSTSDVAPGAKNLLTGIAGNPIRNEEMEPGSKVQSDVAWGVSFQEGAPGAIPSKISITHAAFDNPKSEHQKQ